MKTTQTFSKTFMEIVIYYYYYYFVQETDEVVEAVSLCFLGPLGMQGV